MAKNAENIIAVYCFTLDLDELHESYAQRIRICGSIEVDGGAFMKAGIVTYVLAQMGTSTGAYGVRSRMTA